MKNYETINYNRTCRLVSSRKLPDMFKVWSSAMDGCDCPLCSKLEGTVLPLMEPFCIEGKSVQHPPLHKGCRCAIAYVEKPEPAPLRDYKTFISFINIVNDSNSFFNSANSYNSAIFFLKRISEYTDAELSDAGLRPLHPLKDELNKLIADRDIIINSAIQRAYDYELTDSLKLKTETGKCRRLKLLYQSIVDSGLLSPANFNYLKSLFADIL